MWGLLVFLIGIAYGFMTPGKTDKSRLFWKGLIWGFIAAVVLAIIGRVFNANPLGIRDTGILGFT
ncbi:MAG TPA: hypothetical protein VNZ52_14430, partial [Candidatus Thermoplasmatota archaeon]|nr:hypothetical protein [Candidatus Thermoplasmatota archaeon]